MRNNWAPAVPSRIIISRLWWGWLATVAIGVMVCGISMVLAPGLTRQIFSLLAYSSADHIAKFGANASDYISLLHAILGAVMLGWGCALLFIVLGPLRRGSRDAWNTLVISLVAWFIPDTAFSLWSGFWPNAILNLVLATLFAIPLSATYGAFHEANT